MKVLLTGCSGQLGHALRQRLQSQYELITPGRAELDLACPETIGDYLRQHRPQLIINPAAYTAVDLAETESDIAHRVNALAPAAFAAYARDAQIGLIHFSTDYVFDGRKCDVHGAPLAYLESDACAPLNVYGDSKLAGEKAIVESGCQYLILRTSWVYSPIGRNFLLTILRLAKEKPALHIVNDQWGTPTSSAFLSVQCAQILGQLEAAHDPTTWWQQSQGIYHLTPTGSTHWCEFSQSIVELAYARGLLHQKPGIQGIPSASYPTPAQRPRNSRLDKTRVCQQFGLTLPDWQETLKQCIDQIAQAQRDSGTASN